MARLKNSRLYSLLLKRDHSANLEAEEEEVDRLYEDGRGRRSSRQGRQRAKKNYVSGEEKSATAERSIRDSQVRTWQFPPGYL